MFIYIYNHSSVSVEELFQADLLNTKICDAYMK